MDYLKTFWATFILVVSSSTFSDAVLPEYFQNLVQLVQIFVTKNFHFPGDPVRSLPDSYTVTTDRGQIYLCNDTRMESLAVVRDGNPHPLFTFFSEQLEFDFMYANQIRFDINIDPGQKLTLFCSFPTIHYAKEFFQMVRGNVSPFRPENFIVHAIETYDDYQNIRQRFISEPTLLRQNFIHNRNAADSVEFELAWEPADGRLQVASVEFTPHNYFVSRVVNGKVVLNMGEEEEYYILYFANPNEAQEFVVYIGSFAVDVLDLSDDILEILNTTERLPPI